MILFDKFPVRAGHIWGEFKRKSSEKEVFVSHGWIDEHARQNVVTTKPINALRRRKILWVRMPSEQSINCCSLLT